MLEYSNDFSYRGVFNYLVAYDHSAGHPERYTVFVLNVDDPVTIGRELPLDIVRGLIADYEAEAAKLTHWIGHRSTVLRVKDIVIRLRLERGRK